MLLPTSCGPGPPILSTASTATIAKTTIKVKLPSSSTTSTLLSSLQSTLPSSVAAQTTATIKATRLSSTTSPAFHTTAKLSKALSTSTENLPKAKATTAQADNKTATAIKLNIKYLNIDTAVAAVPAATTATATTTDAKAAAAAAATNATSKVKTQTDAVDIDLCTTLNNNQINNRKCNNNVNANLKSNISNNSKNLFNNNNNNKKKLIILEEAEAEQVKHRHAKQQSKNSIWLSMVTAKIAKLMTTTVFVGGATAAAAAAGAGAGRALISNTTTITTNTNLPMNAKSIAAATTTTTPTTTKTTSTKLPTSTTAMGKSTIGTTTTTTTTLMRNKKSTASATATMSIPKWLLMLLMFFTILAQVPHQIAAEKSKHYYMQSLCKNHFLQQLYRKIDGAVLWSQNERNLDCIITFQTHSILQRFMLRFDMLQLDCNDHLLVYDGAHAVTTPKIDISCRQTKQSVSSILTRTNFVTLKYKTDGWGTDANGFKLVITSVKDPKHTCKDFTCAAHGFCIHPDLLCDGINHCGDNSDESVHNLCPSETDSTIFGVDMTWFVLIVVTSLLLLSAVIVGISICVCRRQDNGNVNQNTAIQLHHTAETNGSSKLLHYHHGGTLSREHTQLPPTSQTSGNWHHPAGPSGYHRIQHNLLKMATKVRPIWCLANFVN